MTIGVLTCSMLATKLFLVISLTKTVMISFNVLGGPFLRKHGLLLFTKGHLNPFFSIQFDDVVDQSLANAIQYS